VPPAEEPTAQKGPVIRERDLEGHLESERPEAGAEEEGDIAAAEREDIQKRLASDNQLNRAVQILRSWNIFSSMVNGTAQE
jgi:hypothetical protein